MSTAQLPSVTGIESWIQHDGGPWLASAATWIVNAFKDTITALMHHQTPDPLQSLVAVLLTVAAGTWMLNRARARMARSS